MDTMQSDRRLATSHVTEAIDTSKRLPDMVFRGEWNGFLVFDPRLLFERDFVGDARSLMEIEGAQCIAMVNLSWVSEGVDERKCILHIDRSLSERDFHAFVVGGKPDESWLYFMDRFGLASNIGEWCIYADKQAEVAVFATRRSGSAMLGTSALRRWNAVDVEDAVRMGKSHDLHVEGFTEEARSGLLRNYGSRRRVR